ncbi:MAG: TonB-dependent receptor [Steroidobacteraceae bacterium]
MKSKVSYAVAAILSGVYLRALAAQPAPDPAPADTTAQVVPTSDKRNETSKADASAPALKEVIVTATRRSENIQNVPVTMQALTGQTMQQLHISSFEDYVQLLPNLTSADNGPGQNEIFIRGVGAGSQATQFSGYTAPWPNVAVYLDDQSVQMPNQNMDIYAVDMNRIEVLEGPQGTLFGSGAEAGAIRYITNKPVLDTVEGNFSGDYGATAHGNPNGAVTGVLNLPVIPHHMAVRFVAYSDRRGGYIDNVPGTFTRHDTDIGVHYAQYPAVNGQCPDGGVNNGYCVPPGSPVANNVDLVRNDINPVTYQGGRIEALYQFNDDWSFLVTQMWQSLDAEGVFFQYPNAPDGPQLNPLEVVLFSPTYHDERDSNTAWTLNGKAGPLSVIYTGGLLTRNLETEADYTNYARGVYGDYYECYGPGSGGDNSLTSTCYSAVAPVISNQEDKHWQHELRAQTPADWRLRGIVGVFEESNTIYDQTQDLYRTVPPCTSNDAPGTPGNTGCFAVEGTFPGFATNPGLETSSTAFGLDAMRQERQVAEFASMSFDLTSHLTFTAGTRHFLFLNSAAGSALLGFGCFEGGTPPGGCHNPAFSIDLNTQDLRDTESGERSQANISWHSDPTLFGNTQHILTYFTFSQGFRPGGFNNAGTYHAPGPDGVDQLIVQESYAPDQLNNYELGWKTNWQLFGRYFQWNGSIYRENWDNVQIEFFDPGLTGTIFFNTNGQDFRIDGTETSFVAQIWQGLKLEGAGAWNSSEQTNSPSIIDNNPASENYGKPITEVCLAGPSSCAAVGNPFGPRGAPAADSPPLRFNLLLRYDWPISTSSYFQYLDGAVAHVQIGMVHTGHSFTQAGSNPPFVPGVTVGTARIRFEDPAYTTSDASIGLEKDDWTFDVYGQNITNSHAIVFTSTDNFIVAQTPIRPRVLGARFTYSF